jgi:hypothetical protein
MLEMRPMGRRPSIILSISLRYQRTPEMHLSTLTLVWEYGLPISQISVFAIRSAFFSMSSNVAATRRFLSSKSVAAQLWNSFSACSTANRAASSLIIG